MKYTSTAMATGVEMPSSTVLSTTCPDDSTVPLPGGRIGASSRTTSSVATMLVPSHHSTSRRQWLTSLISAASYDLDEAVHVAHRLHRAAEALDVAGGAGHEALPAIQAGRAGAERERGRRVRHAQRARRVAAGVLG